MIKGILIYPVLFITTLYWFFVFNDDVVAFMLAFEILYFVTTAVYMLISKKKFNLHMECLHQTAEKNQKVPIRIIAENESKVFPMYFRLYFKIENTLTGEKTKYKTFRIAGRDSRKVITIHVSASDCGYMDVSLKKVRIYDLFTLFSVPKKVKERISVRILPELHLLPIEITRKTRDFISDADEYSTRESGDDPAEIYQIREYKEKDSIHDIHWKLSAKSDELMVKERGKALGSSVLIWVNTAAKNISPDILEIIASVSLSLFELECIHTVAWFEQDKGIVRKKRVSKEINVYELLYQLALIKPCSDEEKIAVIYKDSFKGVNFSTIVEIKADGQLLVNGENKDIPMKNKKIQWEKLALTV